MNSRDAGAIPGSFRAPSPRSGRLVLIVGVYPPETEPTAVMAGELAHAWAAGGYDVTVVCPFPNRPRGIAHPGTRRRLWSCSLIDGVRVLRVWTWFIGPRRRHVNRILENLSFGVASSLALLFLRRPDAVILETWPVLAQGAALIVARGRGLRVYNYIKDVYPEAAASGGFFRRVPALYTLLRRVDAVLCRLATANVAISANMKSGLVASRGLAPAQVRVIRDWIDTDTIRPSAGGARWREETGIPASERVFMFAGTMGYASGVLALADTADRLRAASGIRIVCVGEGVLKDGLLRERERRNLRNLTVLGFQPRGRVSDMQSAADVMVVVTAPGVGVSSVPSKFITYLAVGKPVVVAVAQESDLADIVLTRDLGIVVPPGDPDALAAAFRRMAALPAAELEGMGQRAREVAVREFSRPRALAEFQDLLAETRRTTAGSGVLRRRVVEHLRLARMKAAAVISREGVLRALVLLGRNAGSMELHLRMEGDLARLPVPTAAEDALTFGVLTTPAELEGWEHRCVLEALRGAYGFVQAHRRLAEGQVMITASRGGALAGFLWLTRGGSSQAGYRLGPGEAYYHDAWTFPEHRGHGVFRMLIRQAALTARVRFPGVQKLVAHAARSNAAARAAQEHAGMRAVSMELSVFFLGTFRKFRLRAMHAETEEQHPHPRPA